MTRDPTEVLNCQPPSDSYNCRVDISSLVLKIQNTPFAMSILSWLSFGLAASLTAKLLLPGKENMGWFRTIAVGLIGALLGGVGAAQLGFNVHLGWNIAGFIAAVAGSIVCLLLNRLVTRS